MNPPNNPLEPSDYRHSQSLSESDSLSDSDWLDIASNRESDDNDSVSSRDSDHNEISSPSRRSSMSVGSSHEGEVEAWEGFASDSSDEDTPASEHTGTEAIDIIGSSRRLFLDLEADTAEELRVKDALDQSFIGTLSASRSNSHPSTVQNSLRDLRLSFPDPLTSSRDELNRSYEAVEAVNRPEDISLALADVDVTAAPVVTATSPQCHPDVDPGPFPTPEVPRADTTTIDIPAHIDADIVLYGSPTALKWSFVQDLVDRAASGAVTTVNSADGLTRWLSQRPDIESSQSVGTFAVHDKTEDALTLLGPPSSEHTLDRPSLGVIYLPSSRLNLAKHTFYLPVLSRKDAVTDDTFDQVQECLDILSIPSRKILPLAEPDSGVYFPEDILLVDAARARHALRRLVKPAPAVIKRKLLKGLPEHLNSVHAVTLFALMSLIVSFAVNTAFRATPPSPTRATSLVDVKESASLATFSPIVANSSTAVAVRTSTNVAIVPAALSYLPAIYNRGSTALSTTTSATAPPCHSAGPSKVPAMSEMKATTDVIIRPPATLSAATPLRMSVQSSTTASTITQPTSDSSMPASLSIRLVDSLSEIVGDTVKALIQVLHKDVMELALALDDLIGAIRRQKRNIMEESKSKANALRDQLRYRNNKAKGKAREIRSKGKEILSYAGEEFMGRTARAKARASGLKDSLVTSEAWQSYSNARREWVTKLKRQGSREKRRLGSWERKNRHKRPFVRPRFGQ